MDNVLDKTTKGIRAVEDRYTDSVEHRHKLENLYQLIYSHTDIDFYLIKKCVNYGVVCKSLMYKESEVLYRGVPMHYVDFLIFQVERAIKVKINEEKLRDKVFKMKKSFWLSRLFGQGIKGILI